MCFGRESWYFSARGVRSGMERSGSIVYGRFLRSVFIVGSSFGFGFGIFVFRCSFYIIFVGFRVVIRLLRY